MRLRTRFVLSFVAGTMLVIVLAVIAQSSLLVRDAREQAQSATRAGIEDLARTVERDLLELSDWTHDATEGVEGGAWRGAVRAFEVTLPHSARALVVDVEGAVLWRSSSCELVDAGQLATSSLAPRNVGQRSLSGVLPRQDGALVGASAPLGSPGPRLLVVRTLTLPPELIGSARAKLALLPAVESLTSEAERPALRRLLEARGAIEVRDDAYIRRYIALRDPEGRVALVARASAPIGDLTASRTVLRRATMWMAVIGFVGLALLLRCLQTHVLAPLRALEQHAAKIGRTDHGRAEIRLDRKDELGQLARALNHMLRALDSGRQDYIQSARYAGMSDVSKGFVHSIGNVLTSVNVSTSCLIRELDGAGLGDMRLLIDELRQHRDDLGVYVTEDANGKFLLPFLDAMTTSFEDLHGKCLLELNAVEKGIQHVVQLVRSLDRYAMGGTVVEEIEVQRVIESSLGIACLTQGGARDVEVIKDFGAVPVILIDRHKLSTILIHLLSNALDALAAVPPASRRLEIALYRAGDEQIVIEVSDTGVGIRPEDLDRIFTPGYTTKEGALGEGLHTVGNLCRDLGISIGAISDGPGQGADFKLRVPVRPLGEQRGGAEADSEPQPVLPTISGRVVLRDRRIARR